MRNCYQGWYGERHYTLKEASKILGVTVKTLQNWDKQESPPAYAPYAGASNEMSNLIEDRDFIAALNLRTWGSGVTPNGLDVSRLSP